MKSPFRKATPAELLAQQLDEAQRELITHKTLREYYVATTDMLEKRITRVRHDLQVMINETNEGTISP